MTRRPSVQRRLACTEPSESDVFHRVAIRMHLVPALATDEPRLRWLIPVCDRSAFSMSFRDVRWIDLHGLDPHRVSLVGGVLVQPPERPRVEPRHSGEPLANIGQILECDGGTSVRACLRDECFGEPMEILLCPSGLMVTEPSQGPIGGFRAGPLEDPRIRSYSS